MFEAMVQGWAQQQRARFLRESTIGPRVRLVQRFAEFTGLYPWQWTPEEGEAWVSDLRSGSNPLRFSTVRGYQVEIGLFCSYLLDPGTGGSPSAPAGLASRRCRFFMKTTLSFTSPIMRVMRADGR